MINLIKMNIYRLFHSLSSWILIITSIVIAVLCVSLTASLGKTYTCAENMLEMLFQGGIIMIFCSIFVPLFVNAEIRSGYIRNIGGSISIRSKSAIAQITALAIQLLTIFLLFFTTIALTGKIFYGSQYTIGPFTDIFTLFCVQYLLHLGYISFIMFICTITKSNAFTMVYGILISCNIMSFVYLLINKLVHFVSGLVGFDISYYMIDYNIANFSLQSSVHSIFKSIAVGCLFVVIFVTFISAINKKRDID